MTKEQGTKGIDKPSAWATALLFRAAVADDATAASISTVGEYRRSLLGVLNRFIAEAGGPSLPPLEVREVPVIDLKHVSYDALMEVAVKAPWLPVEYTANDILADIRIWLETTYVHGLDRSVDVESEAFGVHFEQWWETSGQYIRSGGTEYVKTFAYRAAQHYALCARSGEGLFGEQTENKDGN